MQVKAQSGITTHQDGYNEKDRLYQVLMVWSNWNSHTLLEGMENGLSTSENSLAIS